MPLLYLINGRTVQHSVPNTENIAENDLEAGRTSQKGCYVLYFKRSRYFTSRVFRRTAYKYIYPILNRDLHIQNDSTNT